jgi:hypothetical protein
MLSFTMKDNIDPATKKKPRSGVSRGGQNKRGSGTFGGVRFLPGRVISTVVTFHVYNQLPIW